MNSTRRNLLIATSFTALLSQAASAQEIIDNGIIQIGINPAGNLVTGGIGLNYLTTTAASGEVLAPGCACEGWGIADMTTGEYAKAGQSFGFANIVSSSVTASGAGTDAASTGRTATAVADIADGALSLRVTHDFSPSASNNLYRVGVTIENSGAGDVGQLVYRRAMDWDVPPTTFSEFVTIGGWPATALIGSSDDGFVDGNPNVPLTTIASDAVLNGNFTDSGPADHGAAFDFSFGTLAAGDTQDFRMFYGAAPSEADALIALGDVGAEVFSLGQPSTPDGDTLGTPHTFIFGFAGVGGVPVAPGGSAATTPLNFAGQFADLLVDHHLYRSVERLDRLSIGTPETTLSTQGNDITPKGLEGITFRLTSSYFEGDFDTTSNNVGLSYDTAYIAGSVEREFDVSGETFRNGMLGFALGYEKGSASRKDDLGSFDLEGMSYALYGGVAHPTGAFVDGALFYTDHEFDQQRIGLTRVFNSSPSGESYGGRMRAGYNFDMTGAAAPESSTPREQTLGAYVEWTHRNTHIGSFTEDNGGLTTSSFDDESNEIGLGVRHHFAGLGSSENIFGNVDLALLKDLSGGDFSAAQATLGGAQLSRIVDGDDELTLRSSLDIGFARVDGWEGAARLSSRLSNDHSEIELGLQVSRSF